jgi:mono/diheme cytochrome c family protein
MPCPGRWGEAHAWAAELVLRLANLHAARGDRFQSPSGLMHEDRPALAASFALLALAAARDRLTLGGGAELRAAPRPPLEAQVAPAPARDDAVGRGQALFESRGCAGCHAAGADAQGPSLAGVAARYLERYPGRAAAADRLRRFLRDPGAVPPLSRGTWPVRMPRVEGTDAEVADLAEYLLTRVAR